MPLGVILLMTIIAAKFNAHSFVHNLLSTPDVIAESLFCSLWKIIHIQIVTHGVISHAINIM